MKWITREHPKIDRLACPWLIRRFIDKEAEIMYVPFDEVLEKASACNAIPFDVPGVEHTHYGEYCTFDYFIKKYKIKDEAVDTMAVIVRGADTDRHDLAMQASGLWAISAGLAHNFKDDQQLLEKGMLLYDALYSWAKYHKEDKHSWQPFESSLLDVLNTYLKSGAKNKRPAWVEELKGIIQDQIDTNITLKELSKELDIHPSYLSREFSKHFDNLSFGEYIRKRRIDKAKELMSNPDYTLAEISYLTGFSDQSHFTRIFRQYVGESPSVYRRNLSKK